MTTSPTIDTPIHLQETSNGVTVPGPGRWHVHTSSFVGVEAGRGRSARIRIATGVVTVGRSPDDRLRLEATTDHPSLAELTARAVHVAPGPDGFAHYHLTGHATEAGGRHHPIEFVLAFHGVYRRSGETWAWFSGVSRGRGRRRRRPGLHVALDLLAQPGPVGVGTSVDATEVRR